MLKLDHGITIEQFELLAKKQHGVCAICKSPPSKQNRKKRLCIDHCHKTGKIRGLLCSKCNHGIGLFGDDKAIIVSAVNYISHADTGLVSISRRGSRGGRLDHEYKRKRLKPKVC